MVSAHAQINAYLMVLNLAMATLAVNITANPPEKQRLRSLPRAKSKVWNFFGFCEGEKEEIKDTKTVRMLNMSAFLDPRFKGLNPFVPECERKDAIEEVRLELLGLVEKQAQSDPDAKMPLLTVMPESTESSQLSET